MDEKGITFADLLEIVSQSVNMVRWAVKDTKENFGALSIGEIKDYYLYMKVIEFDIDIISGIKDYLLFYGKLIYYEYKITKCRRIYDILSILIEAMF